MTWLAKLWARWFCKYNWDHGWLCKKLYDDLIGKPEFHDSCPGFKCKGCPLK